MKNYSYVLCELTTAYFICSNKTIHSSGCLYDPKRILLMCEIFQYNLPVMPAYVIIVCLFAPSKVAETSYVKAFENHF